MSEAQDSDAKNCLSVKTRLRSTAFPSRPRYHLNTLWMGEVTKGAVEVNGLLRDSEDSEILFNCLGGPNVLKTGSKSRRTRQTEAWGGVGSTMHCWLYRYNRRPQARKHSGLQQLGKSSLTFSPCKYRKNRALSTFHYRPVASISHSGFPELQGSKSD